MAEPTKTTSSVKIEPAKVDGQTLTTTSADNRYITDKEYHAQRTAVNDMRSSNPGAAKLYDRFLGSIEDPKKFPALQADEMKSLQDSAGRHKVQIGSVGNAVGQEMRANKYDTNFRPTVMVEVNGKKMAGDVVASHLKASGVQGDIDVPRSTAPGKVSGEISFAKSEASKLLPGPREPSGWRMVKEELMTAAGTSPAKEAAKAANAAISDAKTSSAGEVKGLASEAKALAAEAKGAARSGNVLVKAGAGLVAGVVGAAANAAEPGATPSSVAMAGVNGVVNSVPGVESYRKGDVCKAFGEATGSVASGATYAAGLATTTTLAVAAGTGTGAVTFGVAAAPVAIGITAGGVALTHAAAQDADKLGARAGQAACESILEGGVLLRQSAGKMMDKLSDAANFVNNAASKMGAAKIDVPQV